MRRHLVLVLFAATAVVAACAPPPAPTDAPAVPTAAWHTEMLASINAERARVGAPPLALCGSLQRAAQAHSAYQAASLTMSHTGAGGSTMVDRAVGAGYVGWTGLAENVAAGQPNVAAVMGAWMNSDGHRANLLSATYQHVGLGVATGTNGAPYWTQDFGRSGAC